MALINLFDVNDPWAAAYYRGGAGSGSGDFGLSLRGMQQQMYDMDRQMRSISRELDRAYPRGSIASLVDKSAIAPTIVGESDGSKKLEWHFDVHGFQPEDITVKTCDDGDKLRVCAKHEDKSDHHHHVREFTRIVKLPEGSQVPHMTSRVDVDKGVLVVDVPFAPPAIEAAKKTSHREIPVSHEEAPKANVETVEK